MDFKKALVHTTVLTAAAVLGANAAAAAEKPKLSLSGYIETYFGGALSDEEGESTGTPTYDGGITDGSFTLLQYGEIRIKVSGQTDSGMKWGVYFEDVQNERDRTSANKFSTDEANIWVSGSWGKLEIGGQDGAGDKFQIDASELSLYDNRIASAFVDCRGVVLRGCEDQITVADSSDDSKFTYYTPRISGFQGGVSYGISNGTRGTVPSGEDEGSVEAGLNYRGKTDSFDYELSAVYMNLGDNDNKKEIDGYGIGGVVGFGPVSFTAGWSMNNNRRGSMALQNNEQQGWTAAATYSGGPWELGLHYISSELEFDDGTPEEDFEQIQLQGAYNLGGGLTLAAGVIYFDLEASDPDDDTDATVFVTKLTGRF